jgi:hypothetical protein
MINQTQKHSVFCGLRPDCQYCIGSDYKTLCNGIMWDYKKDTQKTKTQRENISVTVAIIMITAECKLLKQEGKRSRWVSCSLPYLCPSSLMSSTMSSYASSSLSSSAFTTCVRHTTFVGRAPPTWYTSFCHKDPS